MSYSEDRYWSIKPGDRMTILGTIANVCIEVGEPIFIDRDARSGVMEMERLRVKSEIIRLTESTDAHSVSMTN